MKLLRIIDGLSSIGGAVSAISILLMTAMILLEVGLRAFTGISLLICEEYAAYLLVVFGSMALGYTLKSGAHIRVDLLLSKLAPKSHQLVDLVCSMIGFSIFIYVAIQSWDQFYGSFTSGQTSMYFSKTPLWVPQIFLVLGTLLMTLQFLSKAAGLLRSMAADQRRLSDPSNDVVRPEKPTARG
jgi:TRAP-type C4-dicarboxylate transport system permease small subunit